MVFGNYAKYYNLLYRDKDYEAEATHVHALVQRFATQPGHNLLDVGCGTGTHAARMAQLGYTVTGVDLSETMIAQAREKQIPGANFHKGNATNFALPQQFDVVTSLFHVFSYQTSNENAAAMLRNASAHLVPNGLLVFDFWYGPAVLSEKPSVKIKRLEDAEIGVTRIAEPLLKENENVVDVNFNLLITDKSNGQLQVIDERHPMRYFFKPEIEWLLAAAGLEPVYFREWMTGQPPSAATWGVCCVAVKK